MRGGAIRVLSLYLSIPLSLYLSIYLSIYQSIYLFFYLSLSASLNLIKKQNYSARLPQFLKLAISKKQGNSIIQVDNIRNKAILRDFLQ